MDTRQMVCCLGYLIEDEEICPPHNPPNAHTFWDHFTRFLPMQLFLHAISLNPCDAMLQPLDDTHRKCWDALRFPFLNYIPSFWHRYLLSRWPHTHWPRTDEWKTFWSQDMFLFKGPSSASRFFAFFQGVSLGIITWIYGHRSQLTPLADTWRDTAPFIFVGSLQPL